MRSDGDSFFITWRRSASGRSARRSAMTARRLAPLPPDSGASSVLLGTNPGTTPEGVSVSPCSAGDLRPCSVSFPSWTSGVRIPSPAPFLCTPQAARTGLSRPPPKTSDPSRRLPPTRHPANGGQSRTEPEYSRGKNWGKYRGRNSAVRARAGDTPCRPHPYERERTSQRSPATVRPQNVGHVDNPWTCK